MNKNLLAIAVGAALVTAPMFASAAVKVYGHAQVEVGTVDDGSNSNTVVTDNARGRIGISASEKLGNGLTAMAKFEFKTDTTDNTEGKCTVKGATGATCSTNAALAGRESMVGLKGSFGTVQLGNLKGAYKYYGGVKYDAFVATLLEARGNNGMSKDELGNAAFGHNQFISNSISYMTPKMGGFSGWLTYSPDEAGDGRGSDGDYALGAKFKQKNFEVFVAAVNNDQDDAVAVKTKGDGIKFGGMYKFGNFKIMGQYESLDVSNAAAISDDKADTDVSAEVDIYFLAGQAKFGNNVIVAQFGNRDVSYRDATEDDADDVVNGGWDDDYWTIGLIHNMSKKTRLTAGFSSHGVTEVTDINYNESNDTYSTETSSSDTDIFAVGMRVIF